MNLTLAANALGFVSAWLTQWVAYDRDVLDRLGIAANEKVAGFVHIGRGSGARRGSSPACARRYRDAFLTRAFLKRMQR